MWDEGIFRKNPGIIQRNDEENVVTLNLNLIKN